MLQLTCAYLVAAAMIAGLFFLALRNQKQGWRRHRGVWWQLQPTPPVVAEAPVEHFSDLMRLQQSLASEQQAATREHLMRSR
jgi:hypothetical protein